MHTRAPPSAAAAEGAQQQAATAARQGPPPGPKSRLASAAPPGVFRLVPCRCWPPFIRSHCDVGYQQLIVQELVWYEGRERLLHD